MIDDRLTRKEFLDFAKLSLVFFLSSCQGLTRKSSIGFHKNFIPDSLIASLPKYWAQENINFNDNYLNKNSFNQELIIVNDGWINSLEIDEYTDINYSLMNKLDDRSRTYLSYWDINTSKKLYPIGVIPYALLIKNNHKYKITNKSRWDFLLSREFSGKMILPNSPRLLMSLADRLNNIYALKMLINQRNIYNDINAIDWLVNTDAVLTIMPINQCQKFLKFDSRLSLVFLDQGVPLLWNFLLIKNDFKQINVSDWLDKLLEKNILKNLIRDGWYLPFDKKNIQAEYEYINESENNSIRPSQECWKNSWSLPSLKESEKSKLENLWKESLTP